MMAVYIDTSLLVALFFHEAASAAASVRCEREPRLWVSSWTLAEFANAVAFKLRSAQTDAATAAEAHRRLRAVLDTGGLRVADVERADFEHAASLCAEPAGGLRTPDALHAAMAMRLGLPILTTDPVQAAGCARHAIAAELIGA